MLINKAQLIYSLLGKNLNKLHSITSLAGRVYIANVFFAAGLTKIRDWDTTLFLFEEEYQVPVLSSQIAAILGTSGELTLPVLIALGFGTRFAAIGLLVVNAVAVTSLAEMPPAALYLHGIWGLILSQLIIHGGGWISVDKLLKHLYPLKTPSSAVLDNVKLKVA